MRFSLSAIFVAMTVCTMAVALIARLGPEMSSLLLCVGAPFVGLLVAWRLDRDHHEVWALVAFLLAIATAFVAITLVWASAYVMAR
ncbi:MAG: hypothetical protein HYX69_09555 [Planctomycetia bacterium]|nr:hypothetical protein [Planctomycetia bacterium]